MKVVDYFEVAEGVLPTALPLYETYVPMGFPSPAENYTATSLDITTYLIRRKATTYYIKVEGDSMYPVIQSGALLVVDRSLYPRSGDIVVALINRELMVKRIRYSEDQIYLVAENQAYPTVTITPYTDFEVQGVVTFAINQFKKFD
ncbi:S24 family peptidase [Cytophagaceae bacterium DM2B3-1]|uniref:S24 family peptidase n=1 Tax=Xanthocytophaga flava TaxID=3048013 RepID=A0ABT7CYJ9_9BACT|nr:S24 family peptidase [Xanthocytophaga flavus]MDJ1497664.1 S24 family peptidase [Xanthocytophaga flavus]